MSLHSEGAEETQPLPSLWGPWILGLVERSAFIHEEPLLQRPAALGALPAALGRDCLQPAPAFRILLQQGGLISSLEAASVQAQCPELYRLRLIQSS